MSSSSFRHPENAALSYMPAHSCYLQSQSSAIVRNKTIIAKM